MSGAMELTNARGAPATPLRRDKRAASEGAAWRAADQRMILGPAGSSTGGTELPAHAMSMATMTQPEARTNP
jgi:hypothetical protein